VQHLPHYRLPATSTTKLLSTLFMKMEVPFDISQALLGYTLLDPIQSTPAPVKTFTEARLDSLDIVSKLTQRGIESISHDLKASKLQMDKIETKMSVRITSYLTGNSV
jgi:hypothetical protein